VAPKLGRGGCRHWALLRRHWAATEENQNLAMPFRTKLSFVLFRLIVDRFSIFSHNQNRRQNVNNFCAGHHF
jgi:hypothetical protein